VKGFLPRFLSVNGPIILIGVVALYALGRWDASVDARWTAWRDHVDRQLETVKDFRARQDSLKREQEKAEARVAALDVQLADQRRALSELEGMIARDSAASADAEIVELLPRLHLKPVLGINPGTLSEYFATDSAGVRFLEGLRMDALQAPLVPMLRKKVRTVRQQLTETQRALLLAGERADSADARVIILEGLLEEGRRLSECHIDPFELIPCPSRGMMFIGGAVAGVTVALLR
jgi:hypothetical protein